MAENIEIPLPEDVNWEAIGRGYASVLVEKQARIDRLETLLFALYGNICKGKDIPVLYDNDDASSYYTALMDKFKELNAKITESSLNCGRLYTLLSKAEDTIEKLKHKNK